MRVLARGIFHRIGGAAVRVAFAQHRVDRAAQALGITCLDGFFFVGLRGFRKIGNQIAARLQFLDGSGELRHRRADVGQLDDVGVGQQRQAAELGQRVGHLLFVGQKVWKLSQDTRRHGNVAFFNLDIGRCGEGAHHRQKGTRCQQRRLVGERVDDF